MIMKNKYLCAKRELCYVFLCIIFLVLFRPTIEYIQALKGTPYGYSILTNGAHWIVVEDGYILPYVFLTKNGAVCFSIRRKQIKDREVDLLPIEGSGYYYK
jgi:hypothetical protein